MGMKYIGAGAFVPNIPARDLSDAEVLEHGKDVLLATGLYVEEGSANAADAPKAQKPRPVKDGEA